MPLRLQEEVETRAVDASGNPYLTIEELKRQEAERRAGVNSAHPTMSAYPTRGPFKTLSTA